MAIFGFHMVLTLIAATVFSKLSTRFSVCDHFIFKGLYYYLLEGSLIPVKQNSHEQEGRRKRREKPKEPAQKEDRLIRLSLTSNALEGVPFFDSLAWTANYSCFACAVFIISDLYNMVFPQNKDLNTSMIWMCCALILQIHVVMRIAFEKVSAQALFPERNTLICALGLFFLGSMFLNAFGDRVIDMEFSKGYTQFVDSLNAYVHSQGFQPLFSQSARSPLLFLVCLSLLYSVIAASFFFPVLQFTSLYLDALEVPTLSRIKRVFLHSSFLAPIGALFFFIRPVVEHLIDSEIVTHEQLKALRILSICAVVALRFAMAKTCLQTFLDQPKKKLLDFQKEQMKPEERQRKVANFASYTCITTLQYFLPPLILFSTAFILKNFAQISLLSLAGEYFQLPQQSAPFYRDEVTKIIFARQLQEPLWTLTLVTFMTAQVLIGLVGIVGRR